MANYGPGPDNARFHSDSKYASSSGILINARVRCPDFFGLNNLLQDVSKSAFDAVSVDDIAESERILAFPVPE